MVGHPICQHVRRRVPLCASSMLQGDSGALEISSHRVFKAGAMMMFQRLTGAFAEICN